MSRYVLPDASRVVPLQHDDLLVSPDLTVTMTLSTTERRNGRKFRRAISKYQGAGIRQATKATVDVVLRWQRKRAEEIQHHLGEVTDTKRPAECRTCLLHLVITNGLVQERLGVLIDKALPGNHRSRLSKIRRNPTPTKTFRYCSSRT